VDHHILCAMLQRVARLRRAWNVRALSMCAPSGKCGGRPRACCPGPAAADGCAACRLASPGYAESLLPGTTQSAHQRAFAHGVPSRHGVHSLAPAGAAAAPAAGAAPVASQALEPAGAALDPAAAALQGAWPHVAGVMQAVDALHAAAGLPWWATLSLAACGEGALPALAALRWRPAVLRPCWRRVART